MRVKILHSIRESLRLYNDLLNVCDTKTLSQVLGKPESYALGHHFWCVIGARESHVRSLQKGTWDEVACSLEYDDALDKEKLLGSLVASETLIKTYLNEETEWTDEREQLLLDLLEHEVRHQGQLIRYGIYFDITFPESWKKKFYIDE